MLKSTILGTFLFINISIFCQNFEPSMQGITPFLILNFPNQSATQLYQKSHNWYQEHYNSYNKGDLFFIVDRKIRGNIRISNDQYISIELTFKNQKVKFEIIRYFRIAIGCVDDEIFANEYRFNLGGWTSEYSPTNSQRRKLVTKLQKYCVKFNFLKDNYVNYCKSSFEERESDW